MDKRAAFREAFSKDDLEHQGKLLDRLQNKAAQVDKQLKKDKKEKMEKLI